MIAGDNAYSTLESIRHLILTILEFTIYYPKPNPDSRSYRTRQPQFSGSKTTPVSNLKQLGGLRPSHKRELRGHYGPTCAGDVSAGALR